jgi:1,4-alpha-glucan branching enzyme
MDFYGFYTGRSFDAYHYLGAHLTGDGAVFRTFAPSAQKISLIGEFSGWEELPMAKVYDGNFWERIVPQAKPGMKYKYRIYRPDGSWLDHCDPYGFFMELRPHNASILQDLSSYTFRDESWMRRRTDGKSRPVNIYEVHLGSWHTNPDDPNGWYNYEEIAQRLIPYVKEAGFNYIELMPLSEHPSDASWGYQNTGFFSPTSRYGTPQQLMTLVDRCHQADIGVILDFVPVHFAVDDYALWNYDGTPLYEYPSWDVGRSEWGSCNFMHSRGEVRSFLQSAAHYWLEEFHFDGLRMDAVRNLLYWQGDEARGTNQGGIQFLQELNRGLKERHPTAMLIAEDSSTYPGVTRPADQGGLGFDYKWDMGWMHDTLSYFQSDPWERSQKYHQLTFSMQYFYNERYLLPFSHDEVVHGKATILQKMNGDYEKKFPQARALYLYMFLHPGKKLNFMGSEFGQLREWDKSREQDWDVLRYPIHDGFYHFFQALNRLYLEHPALWAEDYQGDGFAWLDCHQEGRCLYALERRGSGERLAAVFNFSDQCQENYQLTVPQAQGLTLLLDSDSAPYGGSTQQPQDYLPVTNGQVSLTLPPFSGRLYQIQ